MEYRKREIAAGLMIVIAVVLLLLMAALSGNVKDFFREKKDVKVRFDFAEGIEINTPVYQAGILVGKITNIQVVTLEGKNQVLLTLRVRVETVVKKDSKVMIKSPLVGEKFVDIGIGSPDSPSLAPGETLDGVESLRLDQLTDTIVKVVEDLQTIVADIKSITGDEKFRQDIKNIVSNLEQASSDINKIVQQNRGNINSSMADLNKITSQLNTTAQQLNKLAKDLNRVLAENRADIHSMIQNFRDTPDMLMTEVEAIQQAVTTPLNENREDLKKIMENLEKITQNLIEMTEELKKNPWRIIRK